MKSIFFPYRLKILNLERITGIAEITLKVSGSTKERTQSPNFVCEYYRLLHLYLK